MKKNLLGFFLLLTFVFQSSAWAQTATKSNSPARKAADTITADLLKDYLYYVASDEMEGRDTPSRGLDLTAKFIALNLKRWGFKPAGDEGTFFQKIALRRDVIDAEKASVEIGGQKFAYGEDFMRVTGSTNGAVSAPIVYAGNGWMIKSKNLNPYQGIDVKGKFIAVLGEGMLTSPQFIVPLPTGVTQADLTGDRGADWADVTTYARRNGAAGVIVLPSKFLQQNWDGVKQFFGGSRTYVEKLAEPQSQSPRQPTVPVFLAASSFADALFAGESNNPMSGAANASFDLKADKKVNVNLAMKPEVVYTQNVVAIWEGGDAKLKNEMVAIGAHYDHVGVRPNAQGEDKIWNGADDDGSGTVAVLAMAEALAKSPKKPKRSILLVWHAGEEKGLWGSEYFNKFPTVDIKAVTAQLNIDMIGRSRKTDDANPKNKDLSGESEVYVIGSEMMSSKLGEVTKSVNNAFLKLNYNYKYDDPKDENRFFFRSDHFNYAVNGIPIVFWFDGVHEDYHGANDEADRIDYTKMERISRTIFLTMWELADLKERPKVDKQLPPELSSR